MTRETLPTDPIGLDNRLIHRRVFPFHPGKERRTEVEADLRIVVDNVHDPFLRVQDAGGGVRRVTFRGDLFIPIMVGIRGILEFNLLQPRVFSGRLIKMAMDAYITIHSVFSIYED
jgi:hypothetical protein